MGISCCNATLHFYRILSYRSIICNDFCLQWYLLGRHVCRPKLPRRNLIQYKTFFGEIQTGAHKRGLKPQIFRENRAKILPEKSGLFGPDWSLFRAYGGLFGADWDRFLRTSQPRGGSKSSPDRAFLGPIGAFCVGA